MWARDLVLKAARPLAQFVIEAGGFRSSSYSRFFWPGSKVDPRDKAGLIYDNSVVGIGLNFMRRNMSAAPIIVERMQADGTWKVDPKHPFPQDWADPNPWYRGSALTAALNLSDVAAGNSYVATVKRNNGRPGFLYLPHMYVDIVGGDGAALIGHYEYRTPGSGQTLRIGPDDVIHNRNGIDPQDMKKGMSDLAALIRDIGTDNEGTTFTYALLNRMGVPGMTFIPDENLSDVPPDKIRDLKDSVEKVYTGDGAGRMLVMPWKGTLTVPGGPEKLALDTLRSIPTARILAAMGLSDQALGLPSQSKTYDNYASSIEAAWEQGLLPLMTIRAEELTMFVRRWYGDDERTRVWYDLSRVRALQPDLDKLFQRWSQAYTAGVVKRSEAKSAMGLPFDKDDEVYSTEAVMGIDGTGKGLIKAAGALAASRRRALEDLTVDDQPAG